MLHASDDTRRAMAQAILLQDVDTLGERGAVIDVSPGYLRNYLVPRKLAQPATPASIAESQRRIEAAERAAEEAAAKAEETASLLRKTVLTISHQAGDDGRLFGSVTAQEIADAVRQARGCGSTSGASCSRSRSGPPARTWSPSRSWTA